LSKSSTHTTKRSLCDPSFCNPKDVIAADANGYTAGDGSPGKVVSEGALLALGRRYIEALEKREISLEGKKRDIDGEDTAVGESVGEVGG
jgi:hypothetical protein